MKDSMKKFVLRTLIAVLPILLFIALYAFVDPFHIVSPITRDANGRDSVMVGNNAGFASVETYLLYDNKYHYDSFILGSSMSQNFKASYWKPYLDSTASILHFDASSETLSGIINKMRFLNKHSTTIKNALIVIETEMLGRQPVDDDILFIQHPATSGERNWFKFHLLHLNAFRDITQVKYALFPERYKAEMHQKKMITNIAPNRIAHLNEMFYGEIDSVILPSAAQYSIDEQVELQLKQIKSILDSNNTNYIIIIPPCNNRPQLSDQDLWVMKSIFGEDKVHNFSNHPDFVFNERVYYDNLGHLISAKCKILLDSAYYEQQHHSIVNPYFKLH